MSDPGNWILKIISGPHQGAEHVLKDGRNSLGSDGECDVVLHDLLIAPRHFAFLLDKGQLFIEPLEGKTFCGGKQAKEKTNVPKFSFVTAGTTHLVVGPVEERWPLLSIADVPDIEKDVPEPEPAPVAEEKNPLSKDEEKADPKSRKPTPEQRKRALWMAGIGGALLVVWMILWFIWAPRTKASPQQGIREHAEQVVNAFPDAKHVHVVEKDGQLLITGYLDSDSANRALSTALREEVPEAVVRLWSTPRIIETAKAFLVEHNLNLEVSAADEGEIRISGLVRSQPDWLRTRSLLLAETPGLLKIRDEVGLLQAALPGSPAALVPEKENAAPSLPAIPLPPSLEGVSIIALHEVGEGQGWLRLSTGSVYFRGASLVADVRVSGFRNGFVLLEKKGSRYEVAVGQDLAAALRNPLQPTPADSAAAPSAQENLPQSGEKSP